MLIQQIQRLETHQYPHLRAHPCHPLLSALATLKKAFQLAFRQLLHPFQWIDARGGLMQHMGIEVSGENLHRRRPGAERVDHRHRH